MQRESRLNDFTLLKKLGEGAFGQVHLVQRKQDKENYALKRVRLTGLKDKQKDNALNQIRILASIDDDYIIKFKDAFFESSSNNICIVMEYAEGGDLMKMINTHTRTGKKIPEPQIWKALIHITKGLKSLHQKKILHRDLKAANVFISNGIYKLGDLNVSKVLKKQLAYTQTGTPYYASPQVWKDQPYDRKSDMWSLGCVIYEMIMLQPPFKARDLESLFKKVTAGKYKPISSFYSSELSEVISKLLEVRPKNRPDAHQLLNTAIMKKKCGIEIDEQQCENYCHNSMLLETIKYNPKNPNSLRNILPKSSYEKEPRNGSKRHKTRKDSLDYVSTTSTDRALSQCKFRANSRVQTQVLRRNHHNIDLIKQSEKYLPPVPKLCTPLPPIQRRRDQNQSYNANRLNRAGRDILQRRIY